MSVVHEIFIIFFSIFFPSEICLLGVLFIKFDAVCLNYILVLFEYFFLFIFSDWSCRVAQSNHLVWDVPHDS